MDSYVGAALTLDCTFSIVARYVCYVCGGIAALLPDISRIMEEGEGEGAERGEGGWGTFMGPITVAALCRRPGSSLRPATNAVSARIARPVCSKYQIVGLRAVVGGCTPMRIRIPQPM